VLLTIVNTTWFLYAENALNEARLSDLHVEGRSPILKCFRKKKELSLHLLKL